ncbi:MAG TPA: alpha/beta fold hydrolase [Rhodospirillales bacterium]|nr:alpha/beta hydrolase [Rhodospirillaceae bacterium]HIC60560.1 alpha/beta fold hydrolase [Rhodospirillales bacterium]HIM19630.1 alpha/beta fold hydrolase [Rhodospirillales bacterium]HIP09472.1 alpha/beta fold hydrolase [Rhodospirillales bacterium]|tara:strand:+ start:996 stop:1646 length:651 start_codon:yes stop_codon:yes gene_type:complete
MAEVIFNGPDGRLEGRYHQSKKPDAPIAIVLHPHPLHGGNMNNRVVFIMFNNFVERGFSVLRFNFRGVGRSQGAFDNGVGELSDAAYAFDWMQQFNSNSPFCWIGGYSFGALISMQLMMRRPEIEGFVSISPPAGTEDFSFLAPCPSSGLIIHGDKDTHVPLDAVKKLAQKLDGQKNISVNLSIVKGADHFYKDNMDNLSKEVASYLDNSLPPDNT